MADLENNFSAEKSSDNSSSDRGHDTAVAELAEDYAKYLEIEVENEKRQLDESVEEMLTRLDEFCGLVDLIRSDTALCIHETIPRIQEKSRQLQTTYAKIDRLEEFVNMVKANLSLVEEQVNRAEEEIGTFSGIRKMFTTIQLPAFMRKAPAPARRAEPKPRFDALPIYSADDYFGPPPPKARPRPTDTQTHGQTRDSGSAEGTNKPDSGIEVAQEASGDA